MKNIITYEIAQHRFKEQKITDILICQETYKSWKTKCKFYDLIEKDYFWSIPSNVYKLKIVHPNRRNNKAKQTSLKKYGCEHSSQNNIVKQKLKKTCLEQYGQEHHLKSKEIRKKIKQTNIQKYGFEYSQKNKLVKEKVSKTLKKYYNTPESNTNRFIKETGEHLKDWLEKQKEPKPAYITLTQNFKNESLFLSDLEKFLINYKNSKSSLELLVENLFKTKHYNKFVQNLNYRPDFKLSEEIFLNADGLYWHSELQKNKYYHFNLRKDFEENKLFIFQFYSNELSDKTNIVNSIVNYKLNKITNKIYARNCVIKPVIQSKATKFLDNNHLMGTIKAKHIGLYHKNDLVCLLSYKIKKNILNIERFCSLINFNVVGGFSKLLSFIEKQTKNYVTEMHNWVDLRYGTGKHLLERDFKFIKDTLSWHWTDGKRIYNRLKCRANMDKRKLSMKDYAEELGWYKIYDAGQRLYVKKMIS